MGQVLVRRQIQNGRGDITQLLHAEELSRDSNGVRVVIRGERNPVVVKVENILPVQEAYGQPAVGMRASRPMNMLPTNRRALGFRE